MRGILIHNISLARYTSWHVGGRAKNCYRPADLQDLKVFLQNMSPEEEYLWLGLGSNVLIRDGGFPGTVIFTQGSLNQLEQRLDDKLVRAEAGVTCAKFARFCVRNGYQEAAFFAGVPGTIGGALAMNAGAFGGETWKHIVAVETIDVRGNIHKRFPDEFQVAYREVKRRPFEWFVAGYFHFLSGEQKEGQKEIKALLKKRADVQPIGAFSCGSVFRNPPGDYAAKLIESCGLKGKRIGGAHVSNKHANFIINDKQATAKDIEALIEEVAASVLEKTGVQLIKEVHVLGVRASEA